MAAVGEGRIRTLNEKEASELSASVVEEMPSLSNIPPPIGTNIPRTMHLPTGSLTTSDIKRLLRDMESGHGLNGLDFKDGMPWKTFLYFFTAVLCTLVERICKTTVWSSMAETIVETALGKLDSVADSLLNG